jgi:hypothetical protein
MAGGVTSGVEVEEHPSLFGSGRQVSLRPKRTSEGQHCRATGQAQYGIYLTVQVRILTRLSCASGS